MNKITNIIALAAYSGLILALFLFLGGYAVASEKINSSNSEVIVETEAADMASVEKDSLALNSHKEKLSYALGMTLGNSLRNWSVEIEADVYLQGLKDVLSGGQARMTAAEAGAAVGELKKDLRRKQVAKQLEKQSTRDANAASEIQVSYKLDPRLTKGLYMGERWTSPPAYTQIQNGPELIVEARTHLVDSDGKQKKIAAQWVPADPKMVTVTPTNDNEVKIAIHRAGESTLQVASQGLSRKLHIKAEKQNKVLVCSITSEKPVIAAKQDQ